MRITDFIRKIAADMRLAALRHVIQRQWALSGRNADRFLDEQGSFIKSQWERFKDSPMSREDFVKELDAGTEHHVGFNVEEGALFKQ